MSKGNKNDADFFSLRVHAQLVRLYARGIEAVHEHGEDSGGTSHTNRLT